MLILVLENNISISQNIIWQLVSRFLFVFAITVPFDIRDVEYDSQNVITIPLFFGVKIAKIISVFALFICCIISFFQHLELALNLPNLLALILLYILAAIFIQKSDKNKGEIYFSFWVESLSLFSYFLLVISKLIF
jgi:4-hydroxybenzoate polyprenyltransferase